MNSHSIKLSGKFELPEQIELVRDYELKITGSADSVTKHLEGEEVEYVYNFKPLYGEVTTDKGKTIKVIKKGSQSHKLRYEIEYRGLDYKEIMSKIITNLDEIIEKL